MSSIIETIAEAIVGTLNVASWSQSFTATREYAPALDGVATSTDWIVQVVPRATGIAAQTRKGPNEFRYEVDVGFFKAASGDAAARKSTADDGLELVEEVYEFFMKRELTVVGVSAMVVSVVVDPLFDLQTLRDDGIFCSVATLQIQEVR